MQYFLTLLIILYCWLPNIQAAAQPEYDDIFKEVSTSSGLVFHHFNGMTGKFYFPEMTGQGGGFIDFDNDGDQDIYLLQGAILGAEETYDDTQFPPKIIPPQDRLFRNDSYKDAKGNTIHALPSRFPVCPASNVRPSGGIKRRLLSWAIPIFIPGSDFVFPNPQPGEEISWL